MAKSLRQALLPPLQVGLPIRNTDGTKDLSNPQCWNVRCFSEPFATEGGYDLFPGGAHRHMTVGPRKARKGATFEDMYQGSHQNMGADDIILRTHASRLRVEEFQGEQVIRAVHGVEGWIGGVGISEHLSETIFWEAGRRLKFILEFNAAGLDEEQTESAHAQAKSGRYSDTPLKLAEVDANFELRGLLDFAPLNTPPEVLAFNLFSGAMNLKWWSERKVGGTKSDRKRIICSHPFQREVWYRYAAILRARDNPTGKGDDRNKELDNVWDFEVRVARWEAERWREVWTYRNSSMPLIGVAGFTNIFYGKERNLPNLRTQMGGIFRYRQPRVETWLDDSEEEE